MDPELLKAAPQFSGFVLPTLGFSQTRLLFSFQQPGITNIKFTSPDRVEIGTCPFAEEY